MENLMKTSCHDLCHVFETIVVKGKNGFGIFFIDDGKGSILVDGFVKAEDGSCLPAEKMQTIQCKDILCSINGIDVSQLPSMEVIQMLRSAEEGENKLLFKRIKTETVADTLKHALQRVKSRLRQDPEIQLSDIEMKQKWKKEFEQLQLNEKTYSGTSHVSPEEFCECLYFNSDEKKRKTLVVDYPTIMTVYRENNTIQKEWPEAIQCCSTKIYKKQRIIAKVASTIDPPFFLIEILMQAMVHSNWSENNITAAATVLGEAGILCLEDLYVALQDVTFKTKFQNSQFPRWSKNIIQSLDTICKSELRITK